MAAPEAYAQIPNAWGRQGWTTIDLMKIGETELEMVLRSAWASAQKRPKRRR